MERKVLGSLTKRSDFSATISVCALASVLAGCTGSGATVDAATVPTGSERGACYGNGTCNVGLTCASDLCVRVGDEAGVGDAAGSDAGVASDTGRADGAAGADGGTRDATSGSDAASDVGVDVGFDASRAPDGSAPPHCVGTGCNLVGIELMSASTCVLRANGEVACWGRGQEGELGDGFAYHGANCRMNAGESDTDCSSRAVTAAFANAPSAIFTRGTVQGCGLVGAAPEVWCWGSQQYRLGSTIEHARLAPGHVMVDGVAVADGATQIALSTATSAGWRPTRPCSASAWAAAGGSATAASPTARRP
jgi:hypothetical protein